MPRQLSLNGAQQELNGVDAAHLLPEQPSDDAQSPPLSSSPLERGWRVYVAREVNEGTQSANGARSDPSGEPSYDAEETRRWIERFCGDARELIVVPLRRLALWAGVAVNLAAFGIPLGLAGLVAATAGKIPASAWAWPALASIALSIAILLVVAVRWGYAILTARNDIERTFLGLSSSLQNAATDFRSYDVEKSVSALYEKARYWQAQITLHDRLPTEALQAKLAWQTYSRRAWWIVTLSVFAAVLMALTQLPTAIGITQIALEEYASSADWHVHIFGAAVGLFTVSLIGGALLMTSIVNVLSSTFAHHEADPVRKTADWYRDILTQLNQYLANVRTPYGRFP